MQKKNTYQISLLDATIFTMAPSTRLIFALFLLAGVIGLVSAKKLYNQPHSKLRRYRASLQTIRQQACDDLFLKKAYHSLKKASNKIQKSHAIAISEEHAHKNRYRKLCPYDDTRVCKEIDGFYLNGNDVHASRYHYIVTQGPLVHTVADFWKMVLLRKAKTIVTLVMANECGERKCEDFWNTPHMPIEVDGWTIECTEEIVIATSQNNPEHRLTKRAYLATTPLHKKRHFIQFHYENWPDGGVPDKELFSTLLDHVDALQTRKKSPIVVHCSAGVGRSGTFVAAHSLRAKIRRAKKKKNTQQLLCLNIPKDIYRLRCQRRYLVGNVQQLQTVYETLASE